VLVTATWSVNLLVTGIAVKSARTRTHGTTDGGTFKCATRLVADEGACACADETAGCRATLGVGAHVVTVAEGKCAETGDEE
jgi:hypothetical protein